MTLLALVVATLVWPAGGQNVTARSQMAFAQSSSVLMSAYGLCAIIYTNPDPISAHSTAAPIRLPA